MLRIGDMVPDFTAETTEGTIRFHDWMGDDWCVLFSHPKDFTPVCTTELGEVARLKPDFEKRGCKIIGLSVDPVEQHTAWARDIEDVTGQAPNYPLIADSDLSVSKLYAMLPADADGAASTRTAMDNATVRTLYIIGPDRKVRLAISYPMSTGRNFAEVLRTIDSLQLTATHKVATPANWVPGDDVIIVPAVSDEDAKAAFPDGWKAPKPYIRYVPQPTGR